MAEFWDLYDINRNKLGRIHQRGLPLSEGEYHIVVEIWVVNSSDQILLTKRHPDKPWGNYWESTGGSIIEGEDSCIGAKRELLEETGIDALDSEVKFLGSILNKSWFTDSYLLRCDIPIHDLKLQAGEVIDAKWVSITKFEEMHKKELIVPATASRFYTYKSIMNIGDK